MCEIKNWENCGTANFLSHKLKHFLSKLTAFLIFLSETQQAELSLSSSGILSANVLFGWKTTLWWNLSPLLFIG